MSTKDKEPKATSNIEKITHIKIGKLKKRAPTSFIEFALKHNKPHKNEDLSFSVPTNTDWEAPRIPQTEVSRSTNLAAESTVVSINQDKADKAIVLAKVQEKIGGKPDGDSQVVSETKTLPETIEEPKKSEGTSFWPRFLRNFYAPQTDTDSTKPDEKTQEFPVKISDKFSNNLDSSKDKPSKIVNPNSFSAIFNSESARIAGLQRVFRKSMTMLLVTGILFSILTFLSFRLFSTNLLLIITLQILFVTFSNIFYIIVADKSYVWLSLAFQVIVFLAAHTIIGLGAGFSLPTLVVAGIITLLTYFSYLDIEKNQLSSRLFSINQITADATRTLCTVVSLILAIGVFNGILAMGTGNFLRREVFQNEFLVQNLIIGDTFPGLNRIFLKGTTRFENVDQLVQRGVWKPVDPESNVRLFNFIVLNYNSFSSEPIISPEEEADLKFLPESQADKKRQEIYRARAEEVNQTVFANLGYTLDDVLTSNKFKNVVRETYIYRVNRFEKASNSLLNSLSESIGNMSLNILPRQYIFPGIFALLVLFVSFALNYVLKLVIKITNAIAWFFLIKTDFARIDVEQVEAEIVTI